MSCVAWCNYDGSLPDKPDPDSRILSWEIVLGAFSAWFTNQSLGILSGEAPTIPSQLYIAAHSTQCSAESAGTELSGGNYFRTPISLERVSDIQLRNGAPSTTQLASVDWENIESFSLWDDATGGNYYAFGNLVSALSIAAGRGVQFPAGNVTVGIGNGLTANDGFSEYFIRQILGILLGESPVLPNQLKIAARSTISTSLVGGTELSGNGYLRTDFDLVRVTDTARANSETVISSAATAAWSPIVSFTIHDESDRFYGYDNVNAPVSIAETEKVEWPAGTIQVGLGNLTFSVGTGNPIGLSIESVTPLGKPRYTPDPPPEELDPSVRAYYRREYERISDLWPKDYGRRIAALEALVPYASGAWPIVDQGSVNFFGAVNALVACSPLSATQLDLYDYTTEHNGDFWDLQFGDAGTKLYAASPANGGLGQGVAYYSLSQAYDLTTLSYVGFEANGGGYPFAAGFPFGLFMHPDGTSVFLIDLFPNGSGDTTPSAVVEYSLSVAWDMSTMSASPITTKYTTPDVSAPRGLTFSTDGTRFYLGDNTSNSRRVHQYDLSSAWNIATATYTQTKVLSDSPTINMLFGTIEIDQTGENLIVPSGGSDGVYVFAMSTPFDISTATYQRTITLTGTSDIYGAFMMEDCSMLIVSSPVSNNFGSYELG